MLNRLGGQPPPDRVLMARIRRGDTTAFEELYSRYRGRVHAYVWRVAGDEAAEDLTQETFLRVWRARESYQESGSVPGYLIRIARRLAIDELRRRRVRTRFAELRRAEPAQSASPPDNELASATLRGEIDRAIESLPERMREVFSLKRDAGMSYQEIGDQLGISVKTVEVHMSKALRKLRELLAGFNPTNPRE